MRTFGRILGFAALLGLGACAKGTPMPMAMSTLPIHDDFEGASVSADWTVVNGETFALEQGGGELRMVPNRNTVWFNRDQGPGLLRLVSGDFRLSTSTRARKNSAPEQPVDTGYQFSGIIARDPASDGMLGRESYVFSVVGWRGDYMAAETKTTVGGVSTVEGPVWPNGDADLRICRVGSSFKLYDRPYTGSRTATAAWSLAIEYQRPDLPRELQLGLIAYTFTDAFDLRAHFDYVSVEAVSSVDDCTRD